MTDKTVTPRCHSLDVLPNELLLEITSYITDFPSLNGLLTLLVVYDRGVGFVEGFQKEIFTNVIKAGRMHELSRVVIAVMTARNHSTTRRLFSREGEKENFVYKYLRSEERERDGKPHYLQTFSDPVAAIHDISSISEDINTLVRDFAQTRIVKPSEQPERPPSLDELSRIRRAFWHFQLCYELAHGEDSMPSGAEDEAQSQPSRRFVHYQTHLIGGSHFPGTGWLYGHPEKKTSNIVGTYMAMAPSLVVGEIEAVRFHLACLMNTLQYEYQEQGKPSYSSSRPGLLQRLMKDLNYWREDKETPVNHLLVAELRPGLLENSRESLLAHRDQWGFCLWDVERLSTRGLKPASQQAHSGDLSDKAFQECEVAQCTYIDRWVAEKFRAEIKPLEDEYRQRQEQESKIEEEKANSRSKRAAKKKGKKKGKKGRQ
ncbi:hypothetical protein BDR22DRAFT_886328 [Usnea florida]